MTKQDWRLLIFSISVVLVSLLLLVVWVFWPFRDISKKVNYNQAMAQSEKFFQNNKSSFISTEETVLAKHSGKDITLKGVEAINYIERNNHAYIEFMTGSEGMLGGQYWGVYYTSNDMPSDYYPDLNEGPYAGSYYYLDSQNTNFFATEKIEENWYFYYMDYDNNTHGLNWGLTSSG